MYAESPEGKWVLRSKRQFLKISKESSFSSEGDFQTLRYSITNVSCSISFLLTAVHVTKGRGIWTPNPPPL